MQPKKYEVILSAITSPSSQTPDGHDTASEKRCPRRAPPETAARLRLPDDTTTISILQFVAAIRGPHHAALLSWGMSHSSCCAASRLGRGNVMLTCISTQ
ncbi:hypothetical protein OPQ81_009782 [Rhizoctonia solani]|nr:hypothetical protein OPQ81_009782 [Rhizoctonia solani]